MKNSDLIKALDVPAADTTRERKAAARPSGADDSFEQKLAAYYPYPSGQREPVASAQEPRRVTATEHGSARDRKRRGQDD